MKTIFINVVCFLSLISAVSAQIIDPERTAKRTETKVKSRVNRSIDQTVNDGLNDIFKKKKTTSSSSKKSGSVEPSTRIIDVDDISTNAFIGQFRLEVETVEKGNQVENSTGSANYYFYETKSVCVPIKENSSEKLRYIFDLKLKTLTTVKEKSNKKVAIITNRPAIKIESDEGSSKTKKSKMEVTRLNTTNTIEGKKCNKYLIEESNCITTLWVASEFPYNFKTLMLSAISDKDDIGLLSDVFDKVDGLPLRVIREYKNEDKTVNFFLRNVVKNTPDSALYSTSDCEVTDLRN